MRRNANGEFNKVVDVGKSLASDKRTTAKKKVPKGQGDRGRYEAVNRPVPSIPAVLDNAAIAELLIREAETATGHRERAFLRAHDQRQSSLPCSASNRAVSSDLGGEKGVSHDMLSF